jgi:hypothetical protein
MPLISSVEDDAVFAEDDGSVSLHYHRVDKMLTFAVVDGMIPWRPSPLTLSTHVT